MSLLEVRDLEVRFGGVQALDGAGLDVGDWEIVGLIGPNGAGKTTFFDCVSGITRPDRGSVRFRGRDITRMPAHRRAAMGIARTWQQLGVIRSLPVIENVLTARHVRVPYGAVAGILGAPGTIGSERQLRRDAEEILDLLGLAAVTDERVGDLPYGTQKRVDLAMALAMDPALLMLDEPSSGMGPEEAAGLGDTLRMLRDELRLTILMIEHHVPLVAGLCDHVYVLNFGRPLTHGTPRDVQRHPDVVAAYLETDDAEIAEREAEHALA